MELTLESLGLERDTVAEMVVARVAEDLMEKDAFRKRLEEMVVQRVDDAVIGIAGQHVLPNVAAYVETLCLQETNKWGEKKGAPITFVEYLVARADAYLREEVNYEGKARGESGYSSWTKSGTRIAYMVNKHLQYSIQMAMQTALQTANSAIAGGIEEAIKIKLGEVLASLKVKTKVGL